MKKLFVLPVLLGAILTLTVSSEANAATAATASKTISSNAVQVRTRYQTVTVQRGRRVIRETYRVSRYRNGRIVRTLVSRTRVR